MRNAGLRRPGLNARIAMAIAVAGGVAVLLGVWQMRALGHETGLTAALIGIGGVAGILGLLLTFNFLWGVRVVGALRRGDTAIARWTVTAETLEAFRAIDRRYAEAGRRNDYRLPRRIPDSGIEIVFAADGVLVHDIFFGLASTGIVRFRDVRMLPENPLCLEFETSQLTGSNLTVTRIVENRGVLRIPVAPTANEAAKKVLAHYRDVIARKTIVKPRFWRRRVQLGIATALVAALVAAAGFALNEAGIELGILPPLMAVGGTVLALAGLILALIAWNLGMKQRHG